MKKLFFVFLFGLLTYELAFAQQLKSFDDLMDAFKSGKSVSAVFHYEKCKLVIDSVEEKSMDAIGGMEVKSFEYFGKNVIKNPKAFLTFSENILISHPRRGFVYNYVKCKIFDDNTVEINAKYLTTKDYEVVMNETFYGKINDGKNGEGIFLFIKN